MCFNDIISDMKIGELGKFQQNFGQELDIELLDFDENEFTLKFKGEIEEPENHDGELLRYANCDNSDDIQYIPEKIELDLDCKSLLNLLDQSAKNKLNYLTSSQGILIGKLVDIKENGFISSQNINTFTLTFEGLKGKAKLSLVSDLKHLNYVVGNYYVIDLSNKRFHGTISGAMVDYSSDILIVINCNFSDLINVVENIKLDEINKSQLNCSEGCIKDDVCVPFGARLVETGISKYCDISKSFNVQKDKKISCENDYECLTNNCDNGKCSNLSEEISGFKKFLNKFFGVFR